MQTHQKPVYPTGYAIETAINAYKASPNDPHQPSSMPIYQTSTFIQPSANELQEYDYTRSANPTRTALEILVSGMEGSDRAFAFTSGMSALACMTRLLKAGDEILCNADIYGGMYRILSKITTRQGVAVKFVKSWELDEVRKALSPRTKMVHIESPSNPLMMVTDIRALSKIVHDHGALLTIDNTILSAYLMKPLELGADVVVHSGTKFYGGHADVMAGFVCCKTPELSKQIYFHQNAEGTGLAPFDCWLVMRGMKTMCLRIDRAQENAMVVAKWLANHSLITKVHYAGLKTAKASQSPGQEIKHALHMSQAKGAGVLLSFETGDVKVSEAIVSALKVFKITVSFGGCSSVVEMPCLLSHASIPKEEQHIPADVVRMSVGIENINDIMADIAQAFKAGEAVAKKSSKL
ncbi:Cys/Met metabolism PLP-dependent enzyme-domain-containing protein [Baffinella frigidus]|nr:Cys/Met metabolism PLP-dependent enzyme-domain-containing protein [Cryptophyta sp. CCMP2293]